MLNYAIIGFGGLGKTHFGNYTDLCVSAGGVKLVAICDVDEKQFTTKTDTNLGADTTDLNLTGYNLYTDAKEMFEKEQLDFVITAVPTYLHEKIAVMAMERGIHVLSEKPMAINLEQAENMIKVAKENNVLLMIGQCVRYFKAYSALKEMIDSKRFGKVIKADFSRVSGTPIWGWENWYMDEEKSGGAALDLHIHDVDFINYAFGMPDSVSSVATHYKTKFDSIESVYYYGDTIVTAKGEWGFPATSYPFEAKFTVRFETATVEYKNDKLMLYEENGPCENGKPARELVLRNTNGYLDEEIDFVFCVKGIKGQKESAVNPASSSILSLKLALAEKESALTGKRVFLK